ncbi:U32 family peptidase [Stieleria varia]|uniref:Putative protease YhbU n=1 Tax=Stieleria varia TaxID=2528005 RepID=A0A5C6ASI3_9BACT|nr:U32 family peptidase [Stieleria varia]TWU02640.1 putative protease YhbU precursor [Stieleria varia]
MNAPARPTIELLAPAGDWDCARAAVENGADAIYFGLDCGFNARYRAKNFGLDDLPDLMRFLRQRGVRGYTTMNTLVFDSELPRFAEVIEQVAAAGVDAVLVQDLGVATLAHEICPDLEIHASTQMSMTSAETIAVARQLGLSRVVLARELSVKEITQIAAKTDMPLEVFIHGALCVAYSGQCLTSESLGGRSANRGQCAQACRLPYDLICDGEPRDLGDVKYLLSPQDLAGYAMIPELIDAGVASIKIEGRLKTPEYVANISRHYRAAIDEALATRMVSMSDVARQEMELSFSRGFSPGWLEGNDHKRLVPGKQSAKRGIHLGKVRSIRKERIQVELSAPIALGDGLAIQSQRVDTSEQALQGGRIYSLNTAWGNKQSSAEAGDVVWIGFGEDSIDWELIDIDADVFKNDDPKLNRRLRQSFSGADAVRRQPVDVTVQACVGQPLSLTATLPSGLTATAVSELPLEAARKHAATQSHLREQLDRFGATPFELGSVTMTIDGGPMVPASVLNQTRRELADRLMDMIANPQPRAIHRDAGAAMLAHQVETDCTNCNPQLAVLCRNEEQLRAAVGSGVEMVYVDFHDVRKYGDAVAIARSSGVPIAIATVRMQKPSEMGLMRVLLRHQPEWILARNLAAIQFFIDAGVGVISDFSLNVANRLSARWLRDLGVQRVTASYDLNRDQLQALCDSGDGPSTEVVIHQHMPMFHMEHCVFCSVLSPGTNKTNCGRPCDDHVVQLQDRVGAAHTLQADVACRNTLYNAQPQSGAELVSSLQQRGVQWFRLEMLDQSADEVRQTIRLYRGLLSGESTPSEVWQRLNAVNRVGVTRGTLESERNPLAIL